MRPGIHSGFNELVRFGVVIVLTVLMYQPRSYHGSNRLAYAAQEGPKVLPSAPVGPVPIESADLVQPGTMSRIPVQDELMSVVPAQDESKSVDLAQAETMVAPVPEVESTLEPLKAAETVDENRAGYVCVTRRECEYHPIIVNVAERYQVDPAMIKAIIKAESGYNPRAISKQGATGLMQLMPRTARSLGVEDILDPEMNIDGGVKYFKQLLDQFGGEVELALAAYNAGSYRVKKYQGVPPFKATRAYIKKVFLYYQQYRRQIGPNPESA